MARPTQISIQLLFLSFHLSVHSKSVPVQRRRQSCLCCKPSDRSCGLHTIHQSFFGLRSVGIHQPIQHLYPVRFSSLQDSCCTSKYNACLSESYSSCIRELAWSTVTHPFSRGECRLPPMDPRQALEDHVPALGGRVLSFILNVLGAVVQIFSSDSLRSNSRAAR